MDKLELVKRNTAEILTEAELKEVLKKKNPVVYLGTAITRSPHIGYYLWANKLADFIKAGFKVKLLLADLHGALDNTPWDLLEQRFKYYQKLMPLLFRSLGVSSSNLEFIKGSSFQLDKKYQLELLMLSTCVSIRDCHKAASEVVKMGDNPRLSGLIYPLMQALDEEYLGVDIQYGGLDQRKIFVLASEILPKVGYRKRVHVMTPLVPGLSSKKMSASVEADKIDLLDPEAEVERKIKGADMVAGNPDNGVLAFLKHVIFVLMGDKSESLVIERPDKYGGNIEYKTYKELENDFSSKKVHPLDIKVALAREINQLLKPIREDKSLPKLHEKAFPE